MNGGFLSILLIWETFTIRIVKPNSFNVQKDRIVAN